MHSHSAIARPKAEAKSDALTVRQAQTAADGQLWERFLAHHPEATHCHHWGWRDVIQNSFGWPTYYLLVERRGEVCGLLPLVWQKSILFGSFLTSVPYLNAGGVLAADEASKQALVTEAKTRAARMNVRYMELRHRSDPGLKLPTRTHKVSMVLSLRSNQDALSASLPHKVRTDIRKGAKSGLKADFGGLEFLDDFYEVFAQNMRNLGTPVYARRFFLEILRFFPADAFICRVRHLDKTVASSFVVSHRDTVESVWSCSRYDYLAFRPNMFLYWSILCFAMDKGFRFFDFGRSTIGSGTHRFKKQWGSEEVPLYWTYWVPEGATLPNLNPENPRYGLAIRLWQRLPLPLTTLIGPALAKRLP